MPLTEHLTRLYALRHGGVTRSETLSVNGVEGLVHYVDDEEWWALATTLPGFPIVLNEARLRGKPRVLREYAFLHERGHERWPLPLGLAFLAADTGLAVALVLAAVLLPALALAGLLGVLVPIVGLPLVAGLLGIGFLVTLATVPCLGAKWIDETRAELYAVSVLGEERYRDARAELRRDASGGRVQWLWRTLVFPPESLVVAIARIRSDESPD